MINNDRILSATQSSYELKRMHAEEKAYYLNNHLENNAEYYENLNLIKSVIFEINKAEFSGNTATIPQLQEKLKELKEKKQAILKGLNLTEEDLKPQYECPICNDRGYTADGKKCSCFFKNLLKNAEQILGIEKRELNSFEQCDKSLPPFDKLCDKLIAYTQKFPNTQTKNFVFTGNTGTGKTFIASCVAKQLLDMNFTVIFVSAIKLLDVFFRYHTATGSDKSAIFDILTSCDMLIIDDLGTEPFLKNVTVEYLNSIISERLNNSMPFIITTNLDIQKLKDRYTERFVSRISDNKTKIITLLGNDRRRNN